ARIDVVNALDDRPAGASVAFHGRGPDIEPRLLEAEIRAAWRLWRVSTTLDDRLPPNFQPVRPVHRRETACADDCRFHLLSSASNPSFRVGTLIPQCNGRSRSLIATGRGHFRNRCGESATAS